MLEVGSWKLDVRCWIASLTLAMTVLLLSVAAPVLAQEGALPENPAADNALAQDKVFNAAETVLENGLRVIVVPNHRAPVVTQMVWYKVGAADEPFGVSGSAHFLEHLLFRGSKVIGGDDLPPGEFSKIVRGMGGNDNAFTSLDYTAYFQSVPADALEQVMRMEAGRMRGALFSEADIESERNVILEERRQRTDNDPRGRFGEQMIADAFINHPYGKPVIGWLQEMEALSHNDTYSFYQRWYAPNNATLVISGDVEAERVFALAREIYGQVPQQDVPERKRPVSPDFHSKTRVTLEHPIIRQPMFQILYRVPGYRQNREQSLALQLLEEIMSGGQSARLYKSLVAEQKLASGAGMSYRADSWDDGRLFLYATPTDGTDIAALEAALQKDLRGLVANGVSEAELQDAKTRLIDGAIYARDSITGPAMTIGAAISTGASLEDVETWPAQIDAITAEQVSEVAKAYLDPDNAAAQPPVTGVLLPKPETKAKGGME